MTVFADLHSMTEDERIEFIGRSVMESPRSSADNPRMNAFVVEDRDKADRYIQKLMKRFPGIRIIDGLDGPIPACTSRFA
jgi:hypothetical protein